MDNIDIDNTTGFIEFTFQGTGNYDDASMGITDPIVELEPFKPIPLLEPAGPQGDHSEPGSGSK